MHGTNNKYVSELLASDSVWLFAAACVWPGVCLTIEWFSVQQSIHTAAVKVTKSTTTLLINVLSRADVE